MTVVVSAAPHSRSGWLACIPWEAAREAAGAGRSALCNAGPGCKRAEFGTERDGEGTEDSRDTRTGDWVCLEVVLWLHPKISPGSVSSPEALHAPGHRRDAEGQRLGFEVVAWSRVAGGWQGYGEPAMGRSGRVSCGVKAAGGAGVG